MRRFLLYLGFLLVCSCAGGKVQDKAPANVVKPAESVLPAAVIVAPVKKVEQIELVEPTENYSDYTFGSIIGKEGIPFDNIIPRTKEQVAIYKKSDHFTFYYLRRNKLILKKNYSFAELEKIRAEDKYPDKILKDLGAI